LHTRPQLGQLGDRARLTHFLLRYLGILFPSSFSRYNTKVGPHLYWIITELFARTTWSIVSNQVNSNRHLLQATAVMGKPKSRISLSRIREESEYFSYRHPRISGVGGTALKLLFCPFYCAYCCLTWESEPCGTGRRKEYQRKKARLSALRIEKLAQKTESRSRRNSLSIPDWHSQAQDDSSTHKTKMSKRKTYTQEQSSLLSKLPAEVRMMIWEEVVKGKAHVWLGYKQKSKGLMEVQSSWCDDASNIAPCQCWDVHPMNTRTGYLGLLTTCRAVYTEVLPFLYASPTFTFSSSAAFFAFSVLMPTPIERLKRVVFSFDFSYHDSDVPLRKSMEDSLRRVMPRLTGLKELTLGGLGVIHYTKDVCVKLMQNRYGYILDAAPEGCRTYLFFDIDMETGWWEIFEVRRGRSEESKRLDALLDEKAGDDEGEGEGRIVTGRGRYTSMEPITMRELEETRGEEVEWGTVIKPAQEERDHRAICWTYALPVGGTCGTED
jgi:hypothetical protein